MVDFQLGKVEVNDGGRELATWPVLDLDVDVVAVDVGQVPVATAMLSEVAVQPLKRRLYVLVVRAKREQYGVRGLPVER